MPVVPETLPVKNRKAMRAAIKILITRSMVPMFFFITVFFKLLFFKTGNYHNRDSGKAMKNALFRINTNIKGTKMLKW